MDAELKKLLNIFSGKVTAAESIVKQNKKARKIKLNKKVSDAEYTSTIEIGFRVNTAGFCHKCIAPTHWAINIKGIRVYWCGCYNNS